MLFPFVLAAICPFTPNAAVGFYQWASPQPVIALRKLAEESHKLRSGLVRLYLGPRYDYDLPPLAEKRKRLLPQDVWKQPQIRALLDDPCLPTIMLSVYPARDYGGGLDDINLNRPWSEADEKAEYSQMLALANSLYDAYGGDARTFILSNSEADSRLLEIANYTGSVEEGVANLIAWQNTRYRAVADARAAHPAATMRLLNAFEISLVNLKIGKVGDRFEKTKSDGVNALGAVVPKVQFDLLSYSAYESINLPPPGPDNVRVIRPLPLITTQLIHDIGILRQATTKPVMIGELGFSRLDDRVNEGATEHLYQALNATERAKIPYVVLWQAYDGTRPDGTPDGFGLLEPSSKARAAIDWFLNRKARSTPSRKQAR